MSQNRYYSIPENIQRLRCEKRLTQEKLARLISRLLKEKRVDASVSKRTIEAAENPKANQSFYYDTLHIIALALEVDDSEIIKKSPNEDGQEIFVQPTLLDISDEVLQTEEHAKEFAIELRNKAVERAHLLLALIDFLVFDRNEISTTQDYRRFFRSLKSQLSDKGAPKPLMVCRTENFKLIIKQSCTLAKDAKSSSVSLKHVVTALKENPGRTVCTVLNVLRMDRANFFDDLRKQAHPREWASE